jgi:hypothetical protein
MDPTQLESMWCVSSCSYWDRYFLLEVFVLMFLGHARLKSMYVRVFVCVCVCVCVCAFEYMV